MSLAGEPLPIICLSHLRWRFVFQRPQHLMTRAARERPVFFVEEPVRDGARPRLALDHDPSGVIVVTPEIPANLPDDERDAAVADLLASFAGQIAPGGYVLWFLTPMALSWTRQLRPAAIVYDCMDDLASFAFAPPALVAREAELLARADVVFTGGRSLYEARRRRHPNVHCCPSSVDVAHFAGARAHPDEPADQQPIAHPRIGYAGVIDERMDLALIAAVAARRPDWQFVLIGPVVKIDPASVPALPNVHALGMRPYAALPAYLAHWQAAILPFAHNEATRFISPTKTPEYLAAGLPVVSTSIQDVVTPYGELGLVAIADTPDAFESALATLLAGDGAARQVRADAYLSRQSWDLTWDLMRTQLDAVLTTGDVAAAPAMETVWPKTATVVSSPGTQL